MTDVLVDNKFVGTVKNPEEFVDRIISERRMENFHFQSMSELKN